VIIHTQNKKYTGNFSTQNNNHNDVE